MSYLDKFDTVYKFQSLRCLVNNLKNDRFRDYDIQKRLLLKTVSVLPVPFCATVMLHSLELLKLLHCISKQIAISFKYINAKLNPLCILINKRLRL